MQVQPALPLENLISGDTLNIFDRNLNGLDQAVPHLKYRERFKGALNGYSNLIFSAAPEHRRSELMNIVFQTVNILVHHYLKTDPIRAQYLFKARLDPRVFKIGQYPAVDTFKLDHHERNLKYTYEAFQMIRKVAKLILFVGDMFGAKTAAAMMQYMQNSMLYGNNQKPIIPEYMVTEPMLRSRIFYKHGVPADRLSNIGIAHQLNQIRKKPSETIMPPVVSIDEFTFIAGNYRRASQYAELMFGLIRSRHTLLESGLSHNYRGQELPLLTAIKNHPDFNDHALIYECHSYSLIELENPGEVSYVDAPHTTRYSAYGGNFVDLLCDMLAPEEHYKGISYAPCPEDIYGIIKQYDAELYAKLLTMSEKEIMKVHEKAPNPHEV